MFSSDRRAVRDFYKRLTSGEGAEETVFESDISKFVNAWSHDGRFVVYDTGGLGGTSDLYVLPLIGDRRPIVLAAQPGFQHQADMSVDGRLIVECVDRVRQIRSDCHQLCRKLECRQISTNGGREPVWRGGDGLLPRRNDSLLC